jgi:hypothetical protein
LQACNFASIDRRKMGKGSLERMRLDLKNEGTYVQKKESRIHRTPNDSGYSVQLAFLRRQQQRAALGHSLQLLCMR